MKIIVWAVLMCLVSLTGRAQEPAAVPYKQYLAQVLAYYPVLKKDEASVDRAIAAKAVVAASRMPHFVASIGGDYGNDPVYVFGALLRQNRFGSSDFDPDRLNTPKSRRDNSVSVDAEWTLFDFFQTTNKVKAAGFLAESARFQSELTVMEAVLAASEVYDRLTLTDALLERLALESRSGQDDIEAMEALSRKGLALGADFYLARMTLSRILAYRNELLSQRDALNMAFNILRGVEPSTPVRTEPLAAVAADLLADVDVYIEKAVSGRLDIQSLNRLLDAGALEVTAEKKGLAPKIVAYGNAARHSKGLTDDAGDSYGVGVKAKFDLDPGHGPRVKLAQAEERRLSAQLQEAKDRAAKDVTELFYRLKALDSNIILIRRDSTDAQEAVRLLEPLYREGRRSVAEILSARMADVSALENRLKTEAARRLAQLSLALFTGELTPEKAEDVYGH